MINSELYNSDDVKFMKEMVSHHQMALKMAEQIKKNGKNKAVLALADKIILAQTKEIAFMQDWLDTVDGKAGTSAKSMRM